MGSGSAEVYDPQANTWRAVGHLRMCIEKHTATLLTDGRVLLTGGLHAFGWPATAELYDPFARKLSAAGSMFSANMFHTATLLHNGRVLVVGGLGGNNKQ